MAKLKAATRNRLPSSAFGLPGQRKYPMEDRVHQIKAEEFATKEEHKGKDVATQLVRSGFSGMPVADPDGRVVGVVTESDIVRTVIAGKRLENLTAGEVMTGPPITVEVETPIEDVMKQLEENRIVRVPVTDHDRLVGIISRSDIIRAILEPEFIAFGD